MAKKPKTNLSPDELDVVYLELHAIEKRYAKLFHYVREKERWQHSPLLEATSRPFRPFTKITNTLFRLAYAADRPDLVDKWVREGRHAEAK